MQLLDPYLRVYGHKQHMWTCINHRWTGVWWSNLSLDRQTAEPDGCETAESRYSANSGVSPQRESLHFICLKKHSNYLQKWRGKANIECFYNHVMGKRPVIKEKKQLYLRPENI